MQSLKSTAKGIPTGLAPEPVIQKAKVPVRIPDTSRPICERGVEPLSCITKNAVNKEPLVNKADNISPLPNALARTVKGKKYTNIP